MRAILLILACVCLGAAETSRGFAVVEQPPVALQPLYDRYRQAFQFVPNLLKVMAASPALAASYDAVQGNIQQHASLSPPEINIVQMAIARENRCRYCVAAHSTAGEAFFASTDEQIAALRSGAALPEARHEVLRRFALLVYEQHGRVGPEALAEFLGAGYTRQQALDVVACIAAKVMSNYTNALAGTELDDAFAPGAEGLDWAGE